VNLTADAWLGKMGDWFMPEPNTGCWLWLRAVGANGYGFIRITTPVLLTAHRASWLALRGPIPDGQTIDHLCSQRLCVNPDHMEIVSRGENQRRGAARRNYFAPLSQTHNAVYLRRWRMQRKVEA